MMDENKLHSMKWWWWWWGGGCPLCTRPTSLLKGNLNAV